MQLQNKVAIITGAASGIGKAMAERFAEEGAKVVIADLNEVDAQALAKTIVNKGQQALGICMDVTNEDRVEEGVAQAIAHYGDIDILISNAGSQYISQIEELPFSFWKKILAIHLDGAFLTTKACLKNMYAHGKGGNIIYMGSVHSKEASMLKAPYVTAKHGLLGLCKVVAKEGAAHRVRSNVICPGYVRTPLVEKQIPEQARAFGISEEDVIKNIMLKNTVDGEFTTLEDVAEIALFLASFKTNALTGQSLVFGHGWHME